MRYCPKSKAWPIPVWSNKEIIGEENKELESEKKVIADKAALSKLDTINEQVRDFA